MGNRISLPKCVRPGCIIVLTDRPLALPSQCINIQLYVYHVRFRTAAIVQTSSESKIRPSSLSILSKTDIFIGTSIDALEQRTL